MLYMLSFIGSFSDVGFFLNMVYSLFSRKFKRARN